MSYVLNQGTNTSTSSDWLKASECMTLTASDPSFVSIHDGQEIVEPGQAVNLAAADRARLNRSKPGVYTAPERI
jgi:hypothetical protein